MSLVDDIEEVVPVSVLLLRTPVPTSTGTDPYHDAFGSFCLPSFATSALESGTSTPLPSITAHTSSLHTAADHTALDLIKTALSQTSAGQASTTGRRKGKFIQDQPRLMTHHLSYPLNEQGDEIEIEYCVTSFPILSHDLVNSEILADRLLSGHPSQGGQRIAYKGAIVTSQRAVEAYVHAAKMAQEALRAKQKSSSNSPTQWNRIPFFPVGPATASSLRTLPLAPWLRPRLVMGGEATGTGELLANYVIRHFSSPALLDQKKVANPYDPVTPKSLSEQDGTPTLEEVQEPLLYLVGDKNAPTIPQLLDVAPLPTGPIPYEQVQVYETCSDPHFEESCQVLAKSLPAVLSRPVSRRPSHGSMHSRPGSRRPSGSGSRTPNLVDGDVPAASARPHGISGMTSAHLSDASAVESVTPASAAVAPVVPSSAVVNSPASLEPERIDPMEEASILKGLRNKQANSSESSRSVSGMGPPPSSANRAATAKPDWIVFFSPSGVGYALDEFRRRKWLPPAAADGTADAQATATEKGAVRTTQSGSRKYPKIAVLGPTTRQWMVENLGIEPLAVAAKPGPKELKDAIESAEIKLRAATATT